MKKVRLGTHVRELLAKAGSAQIGRTPTTRSYPPDSAAQAQDLSPTAFVKLTMTIRIIRNIKMNK
jgi:hypothetical protein